MRDGITLDEVADDPAEFIGDRVGLAGAVADVLGPHAFTLGDERILVLVDLREDDRLPLPGEVVRVTGALELFDLAAARQDLGIALRDDRLAEFVGKPALLAVDVARPPFRERRGHEILRLTLADLADEPEDF